MATCGIYQIRNKVNGKIYIGSSKNIEHRWRGHQKGKTNSHLAASQNKYGLDNFEYTVLEECSKDTLLQREQYYLDKFHPEFNQGLTARSPIYWKGKHHSQATKDKLSEITSSRPGSNLGRKFSEAWRNNIGLAIKGRLTSKETRKKLSKATKLVWAEGRKKYVPSE